MRDNELHELLAAEIIKFSILKALRTDKEIYECIGNYLDSFTDITNKRQIEEILTKLGYYWS